MRLYDRQMFENYASEKFTSAEMNLLVKKYCDFLVDDARQEEVRYYDFWKPALVNSKYASMVSKLLLEDYPEREPDCFRRAFTISLNADQEFLIKKAKSDPFYRFRERIFDEDKAKFDDVIRRAQIVYNDQLYLNRLDPSKPYEYEHHRGLPTLTINFIKTEMGERFGNPLSLFTTCSVAYWRRNYIPEDNNSNVFDDIADKHGVQVAGALVDIVKKKFMNNLFSSKTLQDMMDKTKEQIQSFVPDEIGDLLFSKSWYRTIAIVLPNYMTEHERKMFKNKHFSGVTPVYKLKGSQISLRATASFVKAITSVEQHSGIVKAETTRPRNRPYGELKAKKPK